MLLLLTLAVLDDNQNWIPFKYYTRTGKYENYYGLYFDLWDTFYNKNKKDLNEYVLTTKFYK